MDEKDYGQEEQKIEVNKQETKKENKINFNIFSIILSIAAILISCGAIYSNTKPQETIVYTSSTTGTNLSTSELDKTTMLGEVANSVVEITSTTEVATWFGQITEGQNAGSGVIMSEDGYIVTNYHVVEGASKVDVTLANGDTYPATYVGGYKENDVAVLKIEATNLRPAVFANSDEILVGETVYAIGNPLGTLGGSVTDGIISAKSRYITVDNGNELAVIQHSAPVSPGNSGGALFNSNGELIGIVTAKSGDLQAENIGFALPSNDVLRIATDIIEYGYVKAPVIGITVQAILTDAQVEFHGVTEPGIYISDISLNSDAKAKGLEVGDLIMEVDGNEINSTNDIARAIRNKEAGDTIEMKVKRDGSIYTYQIELIEK